jgi:hypothetical protein
LLVVVFLFTRKPHPLWNPICWQVIFFTINSARVAKLLLEDRPIHMTEEEQDLYTRVFMAHGITPRQFVTLIGAAQRRIIEAGAVLQEEEADAQRDELLLVYSGGLRVSTNGTFVTRWPTDEAPDIATNGFLGASSFLERLEQQMLNRRQRSRAHKAITARSGTGGSGRRRGGREGGVKAAWTSWRRTSWTVPPHPIRPVCPARFVSLSRRVHPIAPPPPM